MGGGASPSLEEECKCNSAGERRPQRALAGPGLRGQDQQRQQSDRRWLILAVLCIAQLMVVLDATVVNIALPSAQKALHFSNGNRQWMVTAYTLAFGSLLLLGGRLSDLFGRRRTLVTGLVGFALASAVGGAAQSFNVLIAARVVQGIFAAILAPAALSLSPDHDGGIVEDRAGRDRWS